MSEAVENVKTEVVVNEEVKESKLKKLGAKIKSKVTVKNVVKLATVGALTVGAYMLGAKKSSDSEDSVSDADVIDIDDYKVVDENSAE